MFQGNYAAKLQFTEENGFKPNILLWEKCGYFMEQQNRGRHYSSAYFKKKRLTETNSSKEAESNSREDGKCITYQLNISLNALWEAKQKPESLQDI